MRLGEVAQAAFGERAARGFGRDEIARASDQHAVLVEGLRSQAFDGDARFTARTRGSEHRAQGDVGVAQAEQGDGERVGRSESEQHQRGERDLAEAHVLAEREQQADHQRDAEHR